MGLPVNVAAKMGMLLVIAANHHSYIAKAGFSSAIEAISRRF
jgi:hypothetical protein